MGRKAECVLWSVTVNICRFLLAVCFIFSGFVKAVDPVGTQIKLQDYLSAFAHVMPAQSDVLLIACMLAGFEFLLGVYLLLGIYRDEVTVILLFVLVCFTSFTLYIALENPVSDCGCFGDVLVLTNWQTFYKNIFLLVLAVILLVGKRYVIPLISERVAWVALIITVTLSGHFMLSNVRDLPMFDFRPYKVGTDLRKSVLGGRDSRYADFSLMDGNMDDVTDSVLSADGYTFLLISPYLENASQENIDRINDLYYYCLEGEYNMYCVTASSEAQISQWREITCAEYGFLRSDEIPLQTMIRTNPGIVVLKDGAVYAKWSDGNIPLDFNSFVKMENLDWKYPILRDNFTKWTFTVAYFVLPYLLLLLADMCIRRKRN
ncbi:MAG: DoxX family membrane protein [Bacteroidaceae bacterium]|nr:DoxX family membrane protein [Bacteroidaceae bacterium]